MSDKGFILKNESLRRQATGSSLSELAHSTLDQLMDAITTNGSSGAMATLPYICGDRHLHTIRVTIYDLTDEESCEHCAGSGVKGSEEVGDGR